MSGFRKVARKAFLQRQACRVADLRSMADLEHWIQSTGFGALDSSMVGGERPGQASL